MLDVTLWPGGQAASLSRLLRQVKGPPTEGNATPSYQQLRLSILSTAARISVLSIRPAAADWAATARMANLDVLSTGAEPETWLRIEWIGHAKEWLDVIGDGPDGCLVRMRLRLSEAGVYVGSLETSAPPGGQINAQLLRRVGLEALGKLRDHVLQSSDLLIELADGQWCRPAHRPGRRGQPDAHYARWARRYVNAFEAEPRAPIKYLVDHEAGAGRFMTASQVSAFVNKARRRQLLSSASPGQPGGELTAKAKMILGED